MKNLKWTSAYYEPTNELVSIYKLKNDPKWHNVTKKEKSSFYIPVNWAENSDEILESGYTKIPMTYVSGFKRDADDIWVSSHLRVSLKNIEVEFSKINESESHIRKKHRIYELLENKKILFNGKNEEEAFSVGVEDVLIEHKIADDRYSKVLDIVLKFKTQDPVFGKGVGFEVQLSKQSQKEQEERQYHRFLEGYSCVWLHEEDFHGDELINKNLTVESLFDLRDYFIENYPKEINESLQKVIQNISNRADEIRENARSVLRELQETISVSKITKDEINSTIDTKKEFLDNKLKNLNTDIETKKSKAIEEIEKYRQDSSYLGHQWTKEINERKEEEKNKLIAALENQGKQSIQKKEQEFQDIIEKTEQKKQDLSKEIVNDKSLKENIISEISREKISLTIDKQIKEFIKKDFSDLIKEEANKIVSDKISQEIINEIKDNAIKQQKEKIDIKSSLFQIPENPKVDYMVCEECFKLKPITQFRFNYGHLCQDCHENIRYNKNMSKYQNGQRKL